MPPSTLRKIVLALLPVVLVTVLLAVGYRLKSHDRFASDEFLAGWFCLGIPTTCLAALLAFAFFTDKRRRIGQPGYCPRCGEWLRGGDLYCRQCGASTAGWAVPPRMKSDHARELTPERPVSGRRRKKRQGQEVTVQVATEATLAAQYIVEQGLPAPEQTADLTTECLTDPAAARRLYHAAARRLHPDRHGGNQLSEWDHLQEAMEVMKRHHNLE